MPSRKELVRTEILFREVNEHIVELTDAGQTGEPVILLCECGRPDCLVQIEVTAAVYAAVREHATYFIVLPGHVAPEIERVVHREDRYLVVEKVGSAGELAREHEPEA